ncbi:MAG: glycosyltransferase family 2 protein [bacterium]|nr:glycosyltransferase family 2 protein [bacterium]
MELSIIITSYKSPELLKVCIDSIKKNYSGSDYEIVVSDSETTEEISTMMREDYSEIKFLSSEINLWFGGEVRRGYKESTGDFILILNDDIIIKENSIEKLLEYMKNNQEVGVVGPQLLNFNDSIQTSCFRFMTPLTILYRRTPLGKLWFAKKYLEYYLMKDVDNNKIQEVDWILGSAMMTRRAIADVVGLIDKRFTYYFEDIDWCRNFWENGYKVIYYPIAKMYHYHRRSSAGKNIFKLLFFNKLSRIHIASAIKYFWKYRGKPLPKHN